MTQQGIKDRYSEGFPHSALVSCLAGGLAQRAAIAVGAKRGHRRTSRWQQPPYYLLSNGRGTTNCVRCGSTAKHSRVRTESMVRTMPGFANRASSDMYRPASRRSELSMPVRHRSGRQSVGPHNGRLSACHEDHQLVAVKSSRFRAATSAEARTVWRVAALGGLATCARTARSRWLPCCSRPSPHSPAAQTQRCGQSHVLFDLLGSPRVKGAAQQAEGNSDAGRSYRDARQLDLHVVGARSRNRMPREAGS